MGYVLGTTLVILVALKLTNVIDLPWYVVTMPAWLPFVLLVAALYRS